ncbi:class I and II aminotransferase [Conidiobolus coronatus NRRL 28638]|uniref:Class I and II aminotransferase n=1 Tax=Conidiobolus coronatus (strain ATCC 28846 / CBS 209.66 / NRRL 28638) TaxID=796925 RepID=A0A137P325_CONC2|nr:class I and II aminotransferase [Conidiobolus coronatus NRRL 28638]|eukprot:KXN69321.1 class I and II aminotransferase [Conidiobolus coronatus NRRL 28638]
MTSLNPFRLERFFAKYEFNTKYLMCVSDPESLTIKELFELTGDSQALWEEFGKLPLCYTESSGHPELRQLIANLHNPEKISAKNVLVHTGAEEVILTAFSTLVNAEDHIICVTPCYQSSVEIPKTRGCEIDEWSVELKDGKYILDFDKLEALIKPNTKLVAINSPHNPTGLHFTKEDQDKLIKILEPKGIILIADEVNRCSEHDLSYRIPSFADVYENTVSIGVMSKSYGLPGIRIGWAASQRLDILNEMATMKDYTTICNPAPSEFLAIVGLKYSDKLLNRLLPIYHQNLGLLDEFFANHKDKFEWIRPKAGIVTFVKLNAAYWNDKLPGDGPLADRFSKDLLDKVQVLVAPGSQFDALDNGNWNEHFRLGYGRKNLPEVLAEFKRYVDLISQN